MSFIWTKKVKQVIQPQVSVEPPAQEVQLPVLEVKEDKISDIEHKNGECVVSSCEENNEVGIIKEEVNGQEVVLPCVEDSKVVIQEE